MWTRAVIMENEPTPIAARDIRLVPARTDLRRPGAITAPPRTQAALVESMLKAAAVAAQTVVVPGQRAAKTAVLRKPATGGA